MLILLAIRQPFSTKGLMGSRVMIGIKMLECFGGVFLAPLKIQGYTLVTPMYCFPVLVK